MEKETKEDKSMRDSTSVEVSTDDFVAKATEELVELKSSKKSPVAERVATFTKIPSRLVLENKDFKSGTAYNKDKVTSMLVRLKKGFNGKAVPFPIKVGTLILGICYIQC